MREILRTKPGVQKQSGRERRERDLALLRTTVSLRAQGDNRRYSCRILIPLRSGFVTVRIDVHNGLVKGRWPAGIRSTDATGFPRPQHPEHMLQARAFSDSILLERVNQRTARDGKVGCAACLIAPVALQGIADHSGLSTIFSDRPPFSTRLELSGLNSNLLSKTGQNFPNRQRRIVEQTKLGCRRCVEERWSPSSARISRVTIMPRRVFI